MTTMRDLPDTVDPIDVVDTVEPLSPDPPGRREVELGFMFDHSLLSVTARQALDAASRAGAVEELLVERGLLDAAEVSDRQSAVEARLMEQVERDGVGLFVNNHDVDKYAVEEPTGIDCAARIPLCKAACCRLRFPLSRQDVEGGAVRWGLRPAVLEPDRRVRVLRAQRQRDPRVRHLLRAPGAVPGLRLPGGQAHLGRLRRAHPQPDLASIPAAPGVGQNATSASPSER